MLKTKKIVIDGKEIRDDLYTTGLIDSDEELIDPDEDTPSDGIDSDVEFLDEEAKLIKQQDAKADNWLAENGYEPAEDDGTGEAQETETVGLVARDIMQGKQDSRTETETPGLVDLVQAKQNYLSGLDMAKRRLFIGDWLNGAEGDGHIISVKKATNNYLRALEKFKYFNLGGRGALRATEIRMIIRSTIRCIESLEDCEKTYQSRPARVKKYYDSTLEKTAEKYKKDAAGKIASELKRMKQECKDDIATAKGKYQSLLQKIKRKRDSTIKQARETYYSNCSDSKRNILSRIWQAFENFIDETHSRYSSAVGAALAMEGHHNGDLLGYYSKSIDKLFKEVDAMKIAGSIVKVIPTEGSRRIGYCRLREAARETMKNNMGDEYYTERALYFRKEANFLIDYVTVKLIEAGLLSAEVVPTRVDGKDVNKLFLSVNDKYFVKKTKRNKTDSYCPKQISGSFLV